METHLWDSSHGLYKDEASVNFVFFFFNDTATTEIYTLSLHDALPILLNVQPGAFDLDIAIGQWLAGSDRKSTRLNSSHTVISYAVFCLKKKKNYKYLFHLTKKNKNNTFNTKKVERH